jgi:hypothetical protein
MNTIKLVLVAALLSGCAPSLASVQASTPPSEYGAEQSPEDAQRCHRLSRAESIMRYTVAGAGAAAAGTGLGSIPVQSNEARTGLVIAAASAGATAAITEAIRAEIAADYQRDCQ